MDAPPPTRPVRRFGIYAALLVAAFLTGFVPMWLTARARGQERDTLERELRVERLETTLAAAAMFSRRGDYEPAREALSRYYTNLSSEVERPDSAFSEAQRAALRTGLADRDNVITLLARSDPASAERVGEMYVSHRQALGR